MIPLNFAAPDCSALPEDTSLPAFAASNAVLPARERRLDCLRLLAQTDWGSPSGFAGRTCFQAIPALELERLGEAPGHFRWDWIEHSLELIQNRRDCQDFAMVGVVRMLLRYAGSRLLTPERQDLLRAALCGAKFAELDPGQDSCCWLTENHQVQYLSSEFLAAQIFPEATFANTGQPASWHRERARAGLLRWLDWRMRFSFSEWNSACYLDEDAAALLNLAEYSADEEIRRLAGGVLNSLLFHVAVNSLGGVPVGSRGRAYLEDQIFPGESPVGLLAGLIWGRDLPPAKISLSAVLLSAGDFSIDPVIHAVGLEPPSEQENRERHSLDPESASQFGVDPEKLEDYPFFCGAGMDQHHLVTDTRFRYFKGVEKWPGYFYSGEYFKRCKAEGRPFDARAIPYALSQADVYLYRTKDYALGCAQAYRPGAPGYQQFIWSATLAPDLVVFTSNPAPADVPYGRPGPWVGHGVLPKVVQHRNVLIALHRVRPCPIYDQPPWFREDRAHAFFPRGRFDEVIEQAGWCFGRKGDAFIALRCLAPVRWVAPGDLSEKLRDDQPYEWEAPSADSVWICEMGNRDSQGSFARFIESLSASRVEGDLERVAFESPSLGLVETGWDRPLRVGGQEIAIANYPRFANAYCQEEFGAGRLRIACNGLTTILPRPPAGHPDSIS